MKHYGVPLVALLALSFILSCWSSNYQVYTGPPPRTTPLDSATTGAGGYQLSSLPESLTVDFLVPDNGPCSVKVDFHDSLTRLVRRIVDSVYAPGKYSITWDKKDSAGALISEGHYFYKFLICGKEYTRSLDYRRRWR
jgi:hypothetical protein